MRTGTWTCAAWNFSGADLHADTSTIAFLGGPFTGGGLTYNNISFLSAQAAVLTGANSFNNVSVAPGTQVTLPSSVTTTMRGQLTATGSPYGYLYLPGVAGNYASTPDSAALSITGDIDIRCKVALVDWTPSAINMLVAKYGAASHRSYKLSIGTDGKPVLIVSSDGTADITYTSSATTAVADGATKWVRVTRVSATGVVKFYLSDDGSSWNQLGTDVAGTTGAIFDSDAILEIGTAVAGTLTPAAGKFYRGQVLNGVAGTVVFDADFTAKPFGANAFTETNAATVTINGALAQAGDGRVALVSSTPGTPATLSSSNRQSGDYLTVKDSTAAGTGKWYAGAHSVNVSGNTGWTFTPPPSGNFFAFF